LTPFQKAVVDPVTHAKTRVDLLARLRNAGSVEQRELMGREFRTDAEIVQAVDAILDAAVPDELWMNDTFTVSVFHDSYSPGKGWPKLVHLSIRRNDREAVHDWRLLQEVKNMLVGPECEAVELYPAESRLVDTANQYHLFAIEEPFVRFPFGMTKRVVDDDLNIGNSRQRPRS
jgi:hypothetical protein